MTGIVMMVRPTSGNGCVRSSHTSISIEEFGIFDMDCNQIQIMTWRISILSLLTIPVLLSDPPTGPWPR